MPNCTQVHRLNLKFEFRINLEKCCVSDFLLVYLINIFSKYTRGLIVGVEINRPLNASNWAQAQKKAWWSRVQLVLAHLNLDPSLRSSSPRRQPKGSGFPPVFSPPSARVNIYETP